jgi:hypothetical protein
VIGYILLLIGVLENPDSTAENISNWQLLGTVLLTFSASDASFGLIFWSDVFVILCFDFFALLFDEELVQKGNNFWYAYPFIAWHTVSAACASDEA